MRLTFVVAVVLALGCARKPPEEDPIAKVCKHITDVCGKMANFEICVSSAKAMRAHNLEGAKEAERCVLEKKSCQEISMCSMKGGKKVIRTSLRNVKENLEKGKAELDPPAPPPPPVASEPAPAPAK